MLKNLHELHQIHNNTLIAYPHARLARAHLPIYELRKTLEFRAVLRDLYIQYDYELTVPAFRAKCFERLESNLRSYTDYAPMIKIDEDVYEEYFLEKSMQEMTSRVPARTGPRRDQVWYSETDLDRISPVKQRYTKLPTSERDLRLSSLSVHELEDILLRRADRPRVKVRSVEDVRFGRAYPLLEPLILKEDEMDGEKVRLRIAEHKKIVRITIAYTLAFFILVIITFFIIYYA